MTAATIVNPQITDAVTQTSVAVLGEAPAVALGTVYQTLAHSIGILFENAVAAQQQQATVAQAATTAGVTQIYAAVSAGLARSDAPDNMLSLLTALRATQP